MFGHFGSKRFSWMPIESLALQRWVIGDTPVEESPAKILDNRKNILQQNGNFNIPKPVRVSYTLISHLNKINGHFEVTPTNKFWFVCWPIDFVCSSTLVTVSNPCHPLSKLVQWRPIICLTNGHTLTPSLSLSFSITNWFECDKLICKHFQVQKPILKFILLLQRESRIMRQDLHYWEVSLRFPDADFWLGAF